MAKKPTKKSQEKPVQHFDSKGERYLVFEVFPEQKKTVYYFRGEQAKHIDSVTLKGYEGIPPGLFLNKNGWGFGKKGTFLLKALKEHVSFGKKITFTILKTGAKAVQVGTVTTSIQLPFIDVKNLLIKLGRINEDNNNELRLAVASFLSTKFPKKVNISTEDFDEYKPGEMAALLRRKKVAQKVNEEDLESLKTFFPRVIETSLKGKKGAANMRFQRNALIRNTKSVTDKIFLDDVIKEFETNLAKSTLKEEVWQTFLKEKVFRFMSNYVTAIDKENVSLDISYPDFVQVDVYGFVDVFEIKTHDMSLLSFDDSHENFYWKPEVAKAISQIENYIDAIIHSSDDYIKKIRRKKHVDIKVIRPRGYIIAGNSKQLKGEKQKEDFRKLSVSLRNINFILYDELLESLKNLRSKL